ncbi:histidine--tRNA ligase [soil metagenome]
MPDPTPPRLQPPTGTRDFYPVELARRRWIESKWRTVALRHGFEEIDGPTFEHTDLYTTKSGPGIVSEIFGVYSGKDEANTRLMGQKLAAGDTGAIAPYALRPEFTPTLARMFAARAGALPKPCKWFWQGPCYRAEKPQKGRLREFWQWNCDILGGDDPALADAEILTLINDLMAGFGLNVPVNFNHREAINIALREAGASEEAIPAILAILDKTTADRNERLTALGVDPHLYFSDKSLKIVDSIAGYLVPGGRQAVAAGPFEDVASHWRKMIDHADSLDGKIWYIINSDIVRGLAYYTGLVFEVQTENHRALAGGGRYDNLIQTFGGPPTPAVGFGMGDVVLSLVLQEKGLMPSDKQIAAELGLRPDAFVISNGTPESDALLAPMLTKLRRQGLHARRSYKSTKNIGKLLKEASDQNAQYAIILESATEITVKNLDDNTQTKGPTETLLEQLKPA